MLCYMKCVVLCTCHVMLSNMLYNICEVMLYNICHVMLYNMLCKICHVI